jgi:hypothetical protein
MPSTFLSMGSIRQR